MRSAETQAFFKEYFDCSTEDPSGSSLIANLPEVKHAVNLTSFEGSMLRDIPNGGKRMLFKELEANWLFFFSHSRVIVDHSLPLQATEKLPKIMAIHAYSRSRRNMSHVQTQKRFSCSEV
jgi:hypothetical protein